MEAKENLWFSENVVQKNVTAFLTMVGYFAVWLAQSNQYYSNFMEGD